jgi:hypothetical protein
LEKREKMSQSTYSVSYSQKNIQRGTTGNAGNAHNRDSAPERATKPGKKDSPIPGNGNSLKDLPDWIFDESQINSENLNTFLQDNQNFLTKKMYRIIISKIRDKLLKVQNEDAYTRSCIQKSLKEKGSLTSKIQENSTLLSKTNTNEKMDKNYIEMQMYEIDNLKLNLGKQRTQFHKTEEPKNLEDH